MEPIDRRELENDPDWKFDELHPGAYRALVEGVPAILYIDRPDERSTNLYTSPQIEDLLGFTIEEWTSDPDLWITSIDPEDRERVLEANSRSNDLGEEFLSEYRVHTKDGRVVWIRDEASPVRGEDGTLLYWRGVMLDITERKEAEERLRWSLDVLQGALQQRRDLSLRLQQAQEAERRRIAADIHDDPIQVLSAVDMRLQMLGAYPEQVSSEELAALEADVRTAIERLRSLLFELRPAALDREGLVTALRIYLDHTAVSTGWEVEVHDDLADEPDPDLRAALYRMAQEAIVNARKHASATKVTVDVVSSAGGVLLRIRDDGVGFEGELDATPEPGHLGLPTLVESAELAGGWARVTTAPDEGTTLECWLPLDAERDAAANPPV
jgi:PAS domain S-box-containing protein